MRPPLELFGAWGRLLPGRSGNFLHCTRSGKGRAYRGGGADPEILDSGKMGPPGKNHRSQPEKPPDASQARTPQVSRKKSEACTTAAKVHRGAGRHPGTDGGG